MGARDNDDPSDHWVALTKSDSTDITINGKAPRSLYVGGAGDVAVERGDGVAVTFVGAAAGSVLPIRPVKLMSTNTTATDVVALY